MAEILVLPKINDMTLLHCDECENTALNLYLKLTSENDLTLAYKCIACEFIGYFDYKGEDDETERADA